MQNAALFAMVVLAMCFRYRQLTRLGPGSDATNPLDVAVRRDEGVQQLHVRWSRVQMKWGFQ